MSSKLKPSEKKGSDHDKFYSLSACTYSVLEDRQEGDERFNQGLHFAMEGYREFNFDIARNVITEEIEMKPWKQIDFPCDFVDWTKIGFKCGNIIKILTNDPNIPKSFSVGPDGCTPTENVECPDINTAISTDVLVPFYGLYGGISDVSGDQGKYYGLPIDYNFLGYFDIDWRNRVINFKQTVNSDTVVYLEYISDGLNPDGRTIIHPYAFKAIKLYIHWQFKEYDDRVSLAAKQRAQWLYENEMGKVAERQLELTIEDIKEALRSGYRQTVKN